MKKPTKQTTEQEIEVYKQMVLIPHERGVDLVNPVTGKWRAVKSKHHGKWLITVSERLAQHFYFMQAFANVCKADSNLANLAKGVKVTKSADFVAHP